MKNKTILALITFSFLLLIAAYSVRADWELKKTGNLIWNPPQVLGEDEENRTAEVNRPTPQIIRQRDIEDLKVTTSDEGKLKVEVKEKNKEKVTEKQDQFDIETDNEDIKISTGEAKDELEIETGSVSAKLHFPLSIDPTTHALIVTTPAGTKTVTILPAHAADVISQLGVVDNASTEAKFELDSEDGQLVYKIEGKKEKKFLGLFMIGLPRELILSAETGSLISINDPLLTRLLSFLSL